MKYRQAYELLKSAQDALEQAEENLRNAKAEALACLPIKIGNVIPGRSNGESCLFQVDDIEIEARTNDDHQYLNASFVGTKMTKSGNRHAGRHQVYEFANFDIEPACTSVATEIGLLCAEYENECPEEVADEIRAAMKTTALLDISYEDTLLEQFQSYLKVNLCKFEKHGFSTYQGGHHVAVIFKPIGKEPQRVAFITMRQGV